jgi:hypothetical protein
MQVRFSFFVVERLKKNMPSGLCVVNQWCDPIACHLDQIELDLLFDCLGA